MSYLKSSINQLNTVTDLQSSGLLQKLAETKQ